MEKISNPGDTPISRRALLRGGVKAAMALVFASTPNDAEASEDLKMRITLTNPFSGNNEDITIHNRNTPTLLTDGSEVYLQNTTPRTICVYPAKSKYPRRGKVFMQINNPTSVGEPYTAVTMPAR